MCISDVWNMSAKDHTFAEALNDLRSLNFRHVESAMAHTFIGEYFVQFSMDGSDTDAESHSADESKSR